MLKFIEKLEKDSIQFLRTLPRSDLYHQIYYIESLKLCDLELLNEHLGIENVIEDEGEVIVNSYSTKNDLRLVQISPGSYKAYYTMFNPLSESDLHMGVLTSLASLSSVKMVKTTPYRLGFRLVDDSVLKFKRLFLEAIRKGASDLLMSVVPAYGKNYEEVVISYKAAKRLKRLDLFEFTPQEFTIMLKSIINTLVNKSTYDLDSKHGVDEDIPDVFGDGTYTSRISTSKTRYEYKAVFRVHDIHASVRPLDKLGFDVEIEEILRESVKLDSGISLVTGAPGEGKSNTLNSMVLASLDNEIEIMEVSSPPEFRLPIPQVHYENDAEFLQILVSKARRQALDMMVIGEMNNKNIASSVMDLVTSKVHVLTTFHLDRTYLLPYKLKSFLGNEYLDMFTMINFCLNQKLIRQLCEHCKVEKAITMLPSRITDILKQYGHTGYHYYENKGCSLCQVHTKLKVYGEIFRFGLEEISDIMNFQTPSEIRNYIYNKMFNSKSLIEFKLVEAITKGEISPYVLERMRGVI